MDVVKTGQWDVASKSLGAFSRDLKHTSTRAVKKEAHNLRSLIVVGIQSQAPGMRSFKKLSKWTLASRKYPPKRERRFSGTKALIRTGSMMRAITVVQSGDKAFVGIKRSARGRYGKRLVNIAAVHEFGAGPIVIPMTKKMQAYLAILAKKAGFPPPEPRPRVRGVVIIRIPKRPFLGPSYDFWRVGLESRFRALVADEMSTFGGA